MMRDTYLPAVATADRISAASREAFKAGRFNEAHMLAYYAKTAERLERIWRRGLGGSFDDRQGIHCRLLL